MGWTRIEGHTWSQALSIKSTFDSELTAAFARRLSLLLILNKKIGIIGKESFTLPKQASRMTFKLLLQPQ